MTFLVCRPPSRLPIITPIIRSMVKNQLIQIKSQVRWFGNIKKPYVANRLDQWHGFLIRDLLLSQKKTVGLLIQTVWKSIDYVVWLVYIYTFYPSWPQIFGFFIRIKNIGNKNEDLRSLEVKLVVFSSFSPDSQVKKVKTRIVVISNDPSKPYWRQ